MEGSRPYRHSPIKDNRSQWRPLHLRDLTQWHTSLPVVTPLCTMVRSRRDERSQLAQLLEQNQSSTAERGRVASRVAAGESR